MVMGRNDAFRTITCKGCSQVSTGRYRTNQQYCSKECYDRHGRTIELTGWNGTDRERFWRRVQIGADCWHWIGPKHQRGYGRGWFFGKQRRATHVMWFLTNGVWPKMGMLHTCDNPSCVNPRHLYDGSQYENYIDMVIRGRNPFGRKVNGEAQG